MARPRNQEARRRQLVDAALRVIHERGPADLQMKDVANEAGLATGSVYYYYDNVDDLLRHVHETAYDRYYTSRVTAIAEISDPREKIRTMVLLGLPQPADQPISLALYQVAVAKARNPHHADMITNLCGAQVELYREILDDGQTAGHFRPLIANHRIAANIIALEDGYGLGLCTGNHDYDFTEATHAILEAVAIWTQCPELTRATRRRAGAGPPTGRGDRMPTRPSC